MTPAARKRQFAAMERAVVYARRGNKQIAQAALVAERLKDLRAIADRSRHGWTLPEPVQADMFPIRTIPRTHNDDQSHVWNPDTGTYNFDGFI
jgi:hypothetical protein